MKIFPTEGETHGKKERKTDAEKKKINKNKSSSSVTTKGKRKFLTILLKTKIKKMPSKGGIDDGKFH